MLRSLRAVLLALAMLALVMVLASAPPTHSQPLDPPRKADPAGGPTTPDDPLNPNVPCLVAPGTPQATDAVTVPLWQAETLIPQARSYFGVAARPGDHTLFAFGGLISDTQPLSSTERFDTCSGEWAEMAPLPEALAYVSAVEIDGRYYVAGGVAAISDTYDVRASTYVYDPGTDSWTRRADLPRPLGGAALATANGKLYAFGGFDARGPGAGELDTTYEYNPQTNVWLTRTAMLSGTRSLAAAASYNGLIYVAGGRLTDPYEYTGFTNTLIVYNPQQNTWQAGPPMSMRAYGFGLTPAPDGQLYALGGRGSEGTLALRYDPVAKRWDTLSNYFVDVHRVGTGVAYSRGRLFVVGGTEYSYYYRNMSTQSVESLRILDDFCLSTLRVDKAVAQPGSRLRYTIELHSGIEVLNAAGLINTLPPAAVFDGFVANPIGASYNPALHRVEWHGLLNSYHAPVTITYEAVIGNDVRSGQRLTGTLWLDNGLGGAAMRQAVTRLDFFDLDSSVKMADQSALTADGRVTYTVRIEDTSSQTGTITMTDPLPAGVVLITDSLQATFGEVTLDGSTVIWHGTFPTVMTYTNTSGDYEWGDSRGGGTVPGVQYDWIEISETGRGFSWYPPADNDRCYPVPIPFEWQFYGNVVTRTAVQIDGTMYMYGSPDSTWWVMGPNNQPIPGPLDFWVTGVIAPYWDDLYKTPGRMYYQVIGTAPDRKVVIEYHDVSVTAPQNVLSRPGSFELILFERNNAVLMQYQDADSGNAATRFGASATIGLQDTFTHGLQYSYNTPALSDELAILYLPPQETYTYPARAAAVTYAVTATLDALPIYNIATITADTGVALERRAVVWLPSHWVYLPIGLK